MKKIAAPVLHSDDLGDDDEVRSTSASPSQVQIISAIEKLNGKRNDVHRGRT